MSADDELLQRVLDGNVEVGSDLLGQGGLGRLALVAGAFSAVRSHGTEPSLFHWSHLEVREKIGEGGFGEVFRAHDPVLRREVALKLGRRDRPAANAEMIAEARSMARLRHPNILAVHGAEEMDGRVGIWTDLLPGKTLADHVDQSGPVDASDALTLAIQLTSGLILIHERGLVHGDVKPANIMLTDEGTPILMDFGAAAHPSSRTAASRGSPLFMDTATLEGAPLSGSLDVYALGVTLYFVLTGNWPWQETTVEGLRQARAHSVNLKSVPRNWRACLRCLLDENPRTRPTAAELATRLQFMVDAPMRTRRRGVVAVVLVLLSLALGLTMSAWRESVEQESRARQVTQALLHTLQSPRPTEKGRSLSAIDLIDDAIPQINSLLGGQPEDRAGVLTELAETYRLLNDFDGARGLLEQALEACTDCDESTAGRLTVRGLLVRSRLRLDEADDAGAKVAAEQALEKAQALEPGDPLLTGLSHAHIGAAYRASRELDSARMALEAAYDIYRSGADWPLVDRAYLEGEWITLHMAESDYVEILPFARAHFEAMEQKFGTRHSLTLGAGHALTQALIQTGDLDGAMEILSTQTRTADQWLGADAPTTLGLKINQAHVLKGQGRFEEAVDVFSDVRRSAEGLGPAGQESQLVASGNLANLLKNLERWEESEALYRETIALATDALGPTHLRVILNKANFAELLVSRERFAEGTVLIEEIESMVGEVLTDDHIYVSFSRMIRGRARAGMGDLDGALADFDVSQRNLTAKMGDQSGLVFTVRLRRAEAYRTNNQHDLAVAEVEGLINDMEEILPATDPLLLEAIALRETLNGSRDSTS